MTIENDFLPFAVGGSANVLSQSAYAALTSLLQNGFQSGIANSQQLNKVWRQSSIIAAVIAQFIVAETGQTAIDDGTTATLLANLQTAVASASRAQVILTDTGTANTYAAANPSPLTALPTTSGLIQRVSIANANTGASTYAPDGLTAKPIYGLNLSALQGGELVVKGVATMLYVVASTVNSGNGAWVLLGCTGGAFQTAPATASQHAVQFGQLQSGSATYAVDTGTANTYTVAYSPAVTAVTDGLKLRFKAKTANTGASTFSPNGLTAAPIWGGAHSVLQGGEIVANSDVEVVWNSSLNTTGAWVLLECTGGALQVAPATQSQHAMQLGQLGVKYKGVTAITGNKTMAVAELGGIFPVQATSTITLPLASSVPVGSTYTFFYYQSASVPTFVPSGGDVFSAGSGNISTYTPKSTGYIQFTAEVSGLWEITGSATLDQASGFAAATNYFKQPNGKIVAWMFGSASVAGVSNTMPITFPTAIRTISVTCNAAKGGSVFSVGGNISSTSIVDATASGTCSVFIIAIGD